MPFTDEDLKRLKEWIDRIPERALTMPKAELIKALLARLEAAEWVCKRADALGECIAEFPKDMYAWGEHFQALDDSVKSWLRAAGK